MEFRCPVPLDLQLSVLPDQIVSRHQLLQPPEKCILSRHISKAQINLQHFLIEFLYKSGLLHDLPDHRPIEEPAVRRLIIIKWFCPELISQTEDLLLLVIPQCKCKHAVHVVSHLTAPRLIGFDQDLFFTLFS